MKKRVLISLIALVLIACEDILDVTPKRSLEAEQAIQTEQGLQNAINGCYDVFQSLYYGRYALLLFTELASDNARNTGTIIEYGQINNINVLENNLFITNLWRTFYNGINRANTAMYHMERLGLEEERERAYGAELRFIRAWHYYHLALIFKDVPLRTEPTLDLSDINKPATSQQDILSFVKEELNEVKDHISHTRSTRATTFAAKALLARVYLFTGDYEGAIQLATDVIENSGRTLAPDYASLFMPETSQESIFEIAFSAQDENRLAQYFFPSSLAGRYEASPTENLIEAYEEHDERKEVTLELSDANPYCIKYSDIATGTDNVYLFRLAEMYLIRAEAMAMEEGDMDAILGDINALRQRASLDDVSANSHEDLLLIIEDERRLEFAFEGHRWFDLVRTNRATEVIENVSGPDQYYFPIPLSETSTNEDL